MEKDKHVGGNQGGDSSCENCHDEHGVHAKPSNKKEINSQNALIVVVAVLVVMAGVQVFQTQKLLAAVSNGAVQTSAQTQGSQIGLPSQVGGCG